MCKSPQKTRKIVLLILISKIELVKTDFGKQRNRHSLIILSNKEAIKSDQDWKILKCDNKVPEISHNYFCNIVDDIYSKTDPAVSMKPFLVCKEPLEN